MNDLMLYLIQSSLSLAILFGIYWLFLRKDTFFQLNRVYLLLMMFISAIIPLLPCPWPEQRAVTAVSILLEPVLVTPGNLVSSGSSGTSPMQMILFIYLSGAAFFFMRFLRKLITLLNLTRRSEYIVCNGIRVMYLDRSYSPFSFFHYIFIPASMGPSRKMDAILAHECIHIRQLHTIDLLIAEFLTVALWFNPFVWLTHRELRHLHEFLADEGVLRSGTDKSWYQQLILQEVSGIRMNGLTHQFNVSLIKNRIKMITKNRSGILAKGKVLLALPILMALYLLFSAASLAIHPVRSDKIITVNESAFTPLHSRIPDTLKNVTSQKQQVAFREPVFKVADQMPQYPGGEEARISFMAQNLKYPAEALQKGIQGTVFVTFVVKSDGSITDVKILRGIGGGCDQEAWRVVKMMPPWKPGMTKGQAINVIFNLPVKFALEKKK